MIYPSLCTSLHIDRYLLCARVYAGDILLVEQFHIPCIILGFFFFIPKPVLTSTHVFIRHRAISPRADLDRAVREDDLRGPSIPHISPSAVLQVTLRARFSRHSERHGAHTDLETRALLGGRGTPHPEPRRRLQPRDHVHGFIAHEALLDILLDGLRRRDALLHERNRGVELVRLEQVARIRVLPVLRELVDELGAGHARGVLGEGPAARVDALARRVAEARLDAAVAQVGRDRHVFALVQRAGQPLQPRAAEDAAQPGRRRAVRRDVEVRCPEVVQLRHLRGAEVVIVCGSMFGPR